MTDLEVIINLISTHDKTLRSEMIAMKEASENRHVEIMELVTKAFPDGDLDSHYRYHVRLIEDAAARKSIRLEIYKKLAAGSVWAIITYFALKSFTWLQSHVT
jgi:hypothetical protein